MRIATRTRITLLGGLLLPTLAAAPPPARDVPAVGAKVVIKSGATLKVGERVVDVGKSHRVYDVARLNGGWLWLASGPVAGRAKAEDVLSLDAAVALYTSEIERNPHAPWPYYNRGLIHQDRGNHDKALADYAEALRQTPAFVPALINRGNLWLRERDYDRAITDYGEAIRVDPTNVLAHLNRAIASQSKRDLDGALTGYDEAIRLGLKTAAVFNNRGHVREMKGEYERAAADYGEAIRLDPSYVPAWMNRGGARRAEGEYAGALADLAEAIRLAPESPHGYARRAWILSTCPVDKLRDGRDAVALATRASSLAGPRDASVLDVSAAAHAEAGEFAKAVYWESRALALLPKSSPDAGAYRARLRLYQGQKPYRERRTDSPSSRAPRGVKSVVNLCRLS